MSINVIKVIVLKMLNFFKHDIDY